MSSSLGVVLLPVSPSMTWAMMACPSMQSFSARTLRSYDSVPTQSLIARRVQSAPCSPCVSTKQRSCVT
eukprot:3506190-Alexandrium_andersonii.AAC.1